EHQHCRRRGPDRRRRPDRGQGHDPEAVRQGWFDGVSVRNGRRGCPSLVPPILLWLAYPSGGDRWKRTRKRAPSRRRSMVASTRWASATPSLSRVEAFIITRTWARSPPAR